MYRFGTLPPIPPFNVPLYCDGLIEVAEKGLLPFVVVEPYVDIEIARLRNVVDRGVPPFLGGAFQVDCPNLFLGDVVEERFHDGIGHTGDFVA